MKIPICFDQINKTHKIDFMEEISRDPIDRFEDRVVRWCKNCGAVVVDLENDNRLCGVIRELDYPNILTQGDKNGIN